jgi:hypothetical protein
MCSVPVIATQRDGSADATPLRLLPCSLHFGWVTRAFVPTRSVGRLHSHWRFFDAYEIGATVPAVAWGWFW